MRRLHYKCSVEGCDIEHKARGFCATHYAAFKRGATPAGPIKHRVAEKPGCCSEEGCEYPVKANGLCSMHYQRTLRHGFTKYKSRQKALRTCRIEGCVNHAYCKGLCNAHYLKARKWKDFGFTIEDYCETLKAQNGACAICESTDNRADARSGKMQDFAIDHDHATGCIRGLLCSSCNTALGLFGDNPAILRKAAGYVEGNQ